jgi:hypothetical protein
MLEQEQLEVASRTIESAAGRERMRSARAGGLVEEGAAGVGDRRACMN